MHVTQGQYQRVETLSGGSLSSDRQFIRAARTLLSEQGKPRNARSQRHAWLLELLRERDKAESLRASVSY